MGKVDPYLHAVLLLHGAGKEVSKDSISSVLKAGGVEPDEARAKVLAEAVSGVNFDDLLKAAVAVAAPVAAAPAAEGKKEKKEEEPEKKEEQAAEGLASLFG
jgi:large subunit ribosomal protein L12